MIHGTAGVQVANAPSNALRSMREKFESNHKSDHAATSTNTCDITCAEGSVGPEQALEALPEATSPVGLQDQPYLEGL